MSDARIGCIGLRARRWTVLTVLLAVLFGAGFIPGPPAAAAAAPAPSGEKGDQDSLERRLADLEARIAELQARIEALRGARDGAVAPPPAQGLADLEKKVEALTEEIERLRIGAAAQPEAQASVQGFGPAASKVYASKRGVSIGGYGEMLYQDFDSRADDGTPSGLKSVADLERAVLYFGYKFNDRILFNSEIEFEHAVAGDGEPGEVAVEFAYLDFKSRRAFGARAGLLLVPAGFLNELHEPPIFNGARRPEVEQLIIPTTWRENGAGVYGSAGPVAWKVYLMTSLDAAGFTANRGIRGGRQEGAEAVAESLAAAARLDFTPVHGLLLGVSGFTGGVGQGDPSLGKARYTLWEGHAEWNWRGLQARGLYARGTLTDAETVSLAKAETIGSRQVGWYGEIAWNALTLLKKSDQMLSPFFRYESLNTQDRVAPGFTADGANDRLVRTYGITYRPIPNVVLKGDIQDFQNRAGTGVDQVNFALGYLF